MNILDLIKRKPLIGDTSNINGKIRIHGIIHPNGLSGTFTKRFTGDISNIYGILQNNNTYSYFKRKKIDFTNISGDISRKTFVKKAYGNMTNLTGSLYVRGDVSNLRGRITWRLSGECSLELQGDVSEIFGDITGLTGNIDEWLPIAKERGLQTENLIASDNRYNIQHVYRVYSDPEYINVLYTPRVSNDSYAYSYYEYSD